MTAPFFYFTFALNLLLTKKLRRMKKLYILSVIAILISFSVVNAQINKGSLFLGGNIGFNSSHSVADDNSVSYKQDGFTISPTIGKAIKENLILGAGLIFFYNKYRQGPTNINDYQKSNGYGANVFLRRYKGIGKNFYIFLEGTLGGNYTKSYNSPLTSYNNYKRTSFGLGATPGISYAVSKRLQLELGLNQILSVDYTHEKGDKGVNYGVPYKSNSFSITTSLTNSYLSSVYFGFRLLLGK